MTMAISRHSDGKMVSAKLDDFGCEGVFLYDGTVIRGTLGTLPKEEMAYRIWRQMQDPKIKEPQLRAMWNDEMIRRAVERGDLE